MWTTIPKDRIICFTSEQKEDFPDQAVVLITTYAMITHNRRSDKGELIMDKIRGVEWGLMMMDEVHVVPARTFRRVIGNVKAHTRLGLTATLVREDDKISDLNFLIGPKLYEANWLDLTKSGYLANVQVSERSERALMKTRIRATSKLTHSIYFAPSSLGAVPGGAVPNDRTLHGAILESCPHE